MIQSPHNTESALDVNRARAAILRAYTKDANQAKLARNAMARAMVAARNIG